MGMYGGYLVMVSDTSRMLWDSQYMPLNPQQVGRGETTASFLTGEGSRLYDRSRTVMEPQQRAVDLLRGSSPGQLP